MIDQAVQHIVTELNSYLNLRSSSLSTTRITQANLLDQSGSVTTEATDRVVVSLVNVEEDRVFRQVESTQRQADGQHHLIRPEVRINLYLLFIANLNIYDEALKALSHVISFFQQRPYFDYLGIPAPAGQSGRVILEMHTLSFEQINHLWGALGAKYMPSVMYRGRLIAVRDEQIEGELPPIREVQIRD